MKKLSFFAELKRRNVIRAAIIYAGAVWALAQGISQLGPSIGAPEWATRWFLVAAAIGFPFWIALAWLYEFTPQGLKRESEIDPAESIARQLHVANVLEGSVRRSGEQVRITAQLIRAAEGYHLWSETYDRKMDDIFKIQDEIAGKVVNELKVKLLGERPKARPTDPKAYALYLQARELGRQRTPAALAKSDELLRQALEIDPRYAPAWNGLARNFLNKTTAGVLSNQEGVARGREAAEKALEMDPDYAPAHATIGMIAMTGNDLAAAARH